MNKGIDYYFKVNTAKRVYYSSVRAETYLQAKRKLLFSCFSGVEDNFHGESFKKVYRDKEKRYEVLLNKYSHLIEDTTKELWSHHDKFQQE